MKPSKHWQIYGLKRKICFSGTFHWEWGFHSITVRFQWQKPWGKKGAGYKMKELNIIYQTR